MREARPHENPHFGQVWSHTLTGEPLMVVAPATGTNYLLGFEWVFVRLTTHLAGEMVNMFWTNSRYDTLSTWVLWDE